MISSGSLSNVKYYAIRVGFQVRGSPHIHSFLWVLNPPNIEDNIDIPSETDDPLLVELVQTYQIHSHAKSCKKYKNTSCRFNFGKFFTSETIIAQPIQNVSEFE